MLELTLRGETPIYVTIDVETTMDGSTKFTAHPFCPENKMLCYAAIVDFGSLIYRTSGTDNLAGVLEILTKSPRPIVLIGHNIKFDAHYLAMNGFPMERVIGLIDTQFMMYLYNGEKMVSLDSAVRSMLPETPHKFDTLQQARSAGIDIKDIPINNLMDYCSHDVEITNELFSTLVKLLTPKQLVLNNIYARYHYALWAMEFNGIEVDKKELYVLKRELEQTSDTIAMELENIYDYVMPSNLVKKSSPTSALFLNQYLLAAGIEVKDKIAVGTYKNGNTKYKTVISKEYFPSKVNLGAIFKSDKEVKKAKLTNGLISMDNKILTKIQDQLVIGTEEHDVVTKILKIRKIDKLLKTYVQPIAEYLDATGESYLHPVYNTSSTDTGRSSATNPNVQNFPPEIERILKRDNPNFMYVSSDWSQLEMWGAAVLSQDGNLAHDLDTGVDIHTRTYQQAGSPPGITRTHVKGINFGTIYGGKPPTLSQQSGVPIPMVAEIQKALWESYPALKEYYDYTYEDLNKRPVVGNYVSDGHNLNIVEKTSITGRCYRFKQFVNKYNGSHEFSWPQSCNYLIQGFATGDFHPLFIACLVYTQQIALSNSHLPILERTVHDSLGVRIRVDGTLDTDALSNIYVGYLKDVKKLTLYTLRDWIGRSEEEVYFPRINMEHKFTYLGDTNVTSD